MVCHLNAGGVAPVETQRPENQKSHCPKAGEEGCSGSRSRNKFAIPLFVLFRPSIDWMMPTLLW